MLKRGFLAGGKFYSMYAHTVEIADLYVYETSIIFLKIAEMLEQDSLEKNLEGEIAHAGFKRLN
jgi:hypothetical protein